MYLSASLPDMYSILVTALESNEAVPSLEVLSERILHQERKFKERGADAESAMTSRKVPNRPKLKCYNCGRLGHIKKHCRVKTEDQSTNDVQTKEDRDEKRKQSATVSIEQNSDVDSDDYGLCNGDDCASSVSTSSRWIVDSGATSHMCSNKKAFTTIRRTDQGYCW